VSATARRPIRVLELRSVLGTGGGPEKTILLGAAHADPSRFAMTVCYLRDERDAHFQIDGRANGLAIDYVEVRERHSLDPRIWPRLRDLLRERQIDIVHSHDYKTDLLGWMLARTGGIVAMATAHGWSGHGWKEEWVYYPCDRWILGRLPAVIAVSSDIGQAIVAAGGAPGCVHVVPNGIDDEAWARDRTREPAAREAFGLGGDEIAIGAVGRLETEKNYPLLLRAFAEVAREYPRAKLLVAGDGSRRAELSELVDRLGLQGRCALLGQVTDVVLFHHALNVFVMCSDNEGSPNAVLEAMAMETPVVSTTVGGVSDLVRGGQDGLTVARRDELALNSAIRAVLADGVAAGERARSARARVVNEFSFVQRMRKVESLYEELMDRRRASCRSTS
jgi:glycosyltransferase involved in cell wall biosynthesis